MKSLQYLKYLVIILLSGVCHPVFSQNNLSSVINGIVQDDQGGSIASATLILVSTTAPVITRRTMSSETGSFTLGNLKSGKYRLTVNAVGYVSFNLDVIVLNKETLVVPAIKLSEARETLKEVAVTFKRPLVEQKEDRTIVNVGASVLSAGSNTLEILSRLPGVTLDRDNNISLNGKEGVTVMLDDKLTYLSGAQLAALLRSTDGNLVQSIEIMTNPTAKYDAAGKGGIVNIKLKKNSRSGTNGTVVLGMGANRFKDNIGFSLNHSSGKLNTFINLSHVDERRQSGLKLERKVDSAGTFTYFHGISSFPESEHSNTYKLGTDYTVSPRNKIGLTIGGYHHSSSKPTDAYTTIGKTQGITENYLHALSGSLEENNNFNVSLNDKFQIDTLGQQLNIDLDYSGFRNERADQNHSAYFLPDGRVMQPDIYRKQQSPVKIDIRSFKVDYTYPLSKRAKLEAGTKYADVHTDNVLHTFESRDGATYTANAALSNHFIYKERVGAGYVNLIQSYGKTNLQAGLRAEYTNSNGILDTNAPVKNNYLSFFPSLLISHQLDEKNQLILKLSRRIERPDYTELNPFIYYDDEYNYSKGNAFLKSAFTNNLEVGYIYNKKISISAGYNHVSNVIAWILLTDPNTKANVRTDANIHQLDYYYLNMNSPYILTAWWTGNLNLNLFVNRYQDAYLLMDNLNKGKASEELKMTQYFQLKTHYKAELLSSYRTAAIKGANSYKSLYSNDAGISYAFAGNKATLKLAAVDIFNTFRYRISTEDGLNLTNLEFKPVGRNVRMTLNYNFDSKKG